MRIGTRGSALALAQAHWVAARIGTDAEIITITTAGDRGEALSDKSRWVSALEAALLDGSIDVAVHSAKDVPGELPAGLPLAAIPEREDPRDAICGALSLAALRPGARVGTSSLRRSAQIRALRPDVDVVELRGNVDTRLRKLAEGQVDAIVLALAGLRRLGRDDAVGGVLDELVPAAGQGALALQARAGAIPAERLAAVTDPAATACVTAERALTRALDASCQTSVGAHARRLPNGEVELTGWVGAADGSSWIRDRLAGAPGSIGAELAERMLAAGAAELLQ
ncbi:MAG TPA: hydroxymethylbilane synthase [Solirubrobacteraceae bacterium]|jgi:hydroxymethylbilane synthase|nr:hydroxymethylbilane synthase [Solirubrobacteraceae bacterium]